MRNFVESQGKINLNPKISVKRDIQPELIEQLNAKEESTLTPFERSKLRKAKQAEVQFEQCKKAAAEARFNNQVSHARQQKQFHGTSTSISEHLEGTVRMLQPQQAKFDMSHRSIKDVNNMTVDYSDRTDTLQSLEIEQPPKTDQGFYKP